jgi:hypothetical protein
MARNRRRHCLWCATDWPTLRPCCPGDFDHLRARDQLIKASNTSPWPHSGQWLRNRDAGVPEIFQHRFSPPDNVEE